MLFVTGGYAGLTLGPEELVQAEGVAIDVPGYSVPSFALWDGDNIKDLIVGEGSGSFPDARIRVYLNLGTAAEPLFSGYEFVESDGSSIDLSGTQRSRPFLCDWTGDGIPDAMVGYGDGLVHLFQGVDFSGVPEESDTLPAVTRLLTSYPNPFNPHLTIPFEIAGPQRVRLSVYDAAGRMVAVIADGICPGGPGEETWDGRGANGRLLPSGTYLVRMSGDGIAESVKVILLR